MRGGVVKLRRTRRPRLKTTKPSQEKLLNALIAGDGIGELPSGHGKQSPVGRDLTQESTAQTRQPGTASDIRPPPAQRVRSTWTDPQRPKVEDEKADQTAQPTRRAQKPKPPKRRDTSLPEPKLQGQEQASPATRLRKRQIGGDGDEPELKRARLTQKNLARFNKMGRKKPSHNASASIPLQPTDESLSTKTTSTTTSGFAMQARKNSMLDTRHSKPPMNVDYIHTQHSRSRETASPPESRFKRYANNIEGAPNEATMVVKVSGHMLKEYDDDGYHQVFNQAFTAFPKDVGFNNGLSAPQPDFVEGLEMEEYLPFPVDEHVSGAVLYKDNSNSLTLPHLAGEWKGPGNDMEKAKLQSRYDGAALVYARNQALSLMGKPDPPGHAEVRTFTTDGTNINFYTHYAAPSEEDGTLEYHQYQYASANVKDTHQGHKDGYKGIRNAQDHAREQSYALRDQLKGHWKQRRGAYQPIAEETYLDDIPEAPFPAQESNSYPGNDGEVEEPPPSAKSTRYKRTSRKAPLARGIDDESSYKIIDTPSYAPTPPPSEERRRSARLSKARQLSADSSNATPGRKQSSSRGKGDRSRLLAAGC